ncbi:MAG: alpha/beta fold hydrolase [Gemmatimonadales bacterium]
MGPLPILCAMLFLLLALAADTTYTTRVAVAPGESLMVTVQGDGEPVIVLPGLFGSAYSFRHTGQLLEREGFLCVTIELLGMGSSSRPLEADYSLSAQADRVIAVMDSLGIGQAYAMVHSQGASIAMRASYRSPGRIRGIVSLEGGIAEAIMSTGLRRIMRFAPILRLINGQGMAMQRLLREMRDNSYDPDWVTREAALAYVEGMVDEFGITMSVYRRMSLTDEPESLEERLPFLEIPVILLIGEERYRSSIPDEEFARMVRLIPDITVDTIPETGFFIQEEQPGAAVAALLELRDSVESGD